MGKVLSEADVAGYRSSGYFFPITLYDGDGVHTLNDRYHEANGNPALGAPDPHLQIDWLREVVLHPVVLDVIEDVLGPDFFCLGSRFFAKPPRSGNFVSWHQDAAYLGLSAPTLATAWVAFTASTIESGCLRVIPGTHHEQQAHVEMPRNGNMLSRGQEIAVAVDPQQAVDIVLAPGQMSLHHPLLFHGSERNGSDQPRIGFGIQYLPTHIARRDGVRQRLLLARGVDRYGHHECVQ